MEKTVIVVSGLPRSGTSMMMQMLDAGGVEVLTDNLRLPDEDNPKGYYEYEAVKATAEDPSWLDDAGGRAVKMVYRLLYDLPADRRYRVVFMKRDLEEVIKSQEVMLGSSGQVRRQSRPCPPRRSVRSPASRSASLAGCSGQLRCPLRRFP